MPLGIGVAENPPVRYIRPQDPFGMGFVRPEVYECATTTEHAESAGQGVFWICGYKKGRSRVDGVDQLPQWAAGYDLTVSLLDNVPPALAQETAGWFVDPSYQYEWFSVVGGGPHVGYHFAVLTYLALHLAKVGGKRVRYMHLVSQNDKKYQVRSTHWTRR